MAIQGADELIATIPYLLGFHPQESVVLIWISNDAIVLTQRFDIAHMPRSEPDADAILGPGLRVGATALAAVLYSQAPHSSASLTWMIRACDYGITLLDVVRTDGLRWWSQVCDQECCPPEGRLIDPSLQEAVAAEFVLHGHVAYLNRDDLLREVEPDQGLITATVGAMGELPSHEPGDLLAACLRQWKRVQRQQQRQVRARILATHIAALRHVPTRDAIGWHLAQLDRSSLQAVCWLMRAVLRSAPDGEVAPVGTMAGIAHWLMGDGARAAVCLERALSDNPQYVLGQLIARSLEAGLPPAHWREMIRSIPVTSLSA